MLGQIPRHGLQPALRAGPAVEQRLSLLAAKKQSGALRAEQSLVPRHRDECRAERIHLHRQDTRRLRSVHNELHTLFPAERRDPVDRKDIAEDVGDLRADGELCLPQRRLPLIQQRIGRKQAPACDEDLRAEGVQRARDRVVLIAGDQHPHPRPYQRAQRDIQRMGRVKGKDDAGGVGYVKERRGFLTAGVDGLGRPQGGFVPTAAGARHAAHGLQHRPLHRNRLSQGGRRAVQIDQGSTSR